MSLWKDSPASTVLVGMESSYINESPEESDVSPGMDVVHNDKGYERSNSPEFTALLLSRRTIWS